MSDPSYVGETVDIYEWPQPTCELHDKKSDSYVHIRSPKDAKAVIDSLTKFLEVIGDE